MSDKIFIPNKTYNAEGVNDYLLKKTELINDEIEPIKRGISKILKSA